MICVAVPAFAQIDIIGFINTQEPVASWTPEKKQAMLNDLCSTHGYQEIIDDLPNPETKKQFANRIILWQIKKWVEGWRKSVAIQGLTIDEINLTE
jgi:hypothetical protein